MEIKAVLVHITFGSYEEAEQVASEVVQNKLAACAQLFPIRSFFTWQNDSKAEDEFIVQLKTTEQHLKAIESFVVENHSYEVPEILAVPIVWAHQPYLNWLKQQTP